MNDIDTRQQTLAYALPREIERCQQLLVDYAQIGPAGTIASMMIRAELAAATKQRDEARQLFCRHFAYQMSRLTGVFDPKEVAVKNGWDCFAEEKPDA